MRASVAELCAEPYTAAGSIVRKVADLVRVAVQSDVIQLALAGRYWREVPFAMMGPDGMLEGSIDLVIEDGTGLVTIVDYKTDFVTPDMSADLEAIYAPQMESYVGVLRNLGVEQVTSTLLFLRSHV